MQAETSAIRDCTSWLGIHSKTIAGYIQSAWAALGPLFGVFVGGYLTARSQSKKWIADGKKEEYREVLASLMKTVEAGPELNDNVSRLSPTTFSIERFDEQANRSLAIIADRLLIADEMERLKVGTRWHAAIKQFRTSGGNDTNLFHVAAALRKEILASARKHVRL